MSGIKMDKRKMGNHPKHPKCPYCGKAIYKSNKKGMPVIKTDPWSWCRNIKCKKYNIKFTKKEIEQIRLDNKIIKKIKLNKNKIISLEVFGKISPIFEKTNFSVEYIFNNEEFVFIGNYDEIKIELNKYNFILTDDYFQDAYIDALNGLNNEKNKKNIV